MIEDFMKRSNTKLIFVPFDTLSNERLEKLKDHIIVWINTKFSESYAQYVMDMCIEQTKDMDLICYTITPLKELVFFENF